MEGVVGDELRSVHLVERDREGRVRRDLVADALSIQRYERGIALHLRDGVTIQGERTLPFLDGRMRLILPRARHEDWEAAELPGLSAPAEPELEFASPEGADG